MHYRFIVDIGIVIGIIAGLVALWAALLVLFFALRPKGVPVREIVGFVPDVLRLLRSIVGDGSAPPDVRFVLIGLIAWILSPIDLIPEFIPILGPLDDVVVAVVALRYVRRRIGIDDLQQALVRDTRGLRPPGPGHRLELIHHLRVARPRSGIGRPGSNSSRSH